MMSYFAFEDLGNSPTISVHLNHSPVLHEIELMCTLNASVHALTHAWYSRKVNEQLRTPMNPFVSSTQERQIENSGKLNRPLQVEINDLQTGKGSFQATRAYCVHGLGLS